MVNRGLIRINYVRNVAGKVRHLLGHLNMLFENRTDAWRLPATALPKYGGRRADSHTEEAWRISSVRRPPFFLRAPLTLLLISLGVVAAVWWWLGTPVSLVRAPIDPNNKLQCISYAPFRSRQTSLSPATQVSREQIAEDLVQLAKISDCIRTYATDLGLDQIPELAAKAGLKVIQGIFLDKDRQKNATQIATAIRLSKQFPGTIIALVVGNETLLRHDITASDLAATIRSVKAQVAVPVTYADVWEFWLSNRELYDAVDFVTVHILPYWENVPIRAEFAAAHVDTIRRRIASAFPGKEILIGEIGWPSEGRMRESALPSRVNQARVVSEVLDLARRENFRVNPFEAYDESWKRDIEGTVGGSWGLFDSVQRTLKYPPGIPISNFPLWKLQMYSGMALAVLVFGAAWLTLRRKPGEPRLISWLAVGLSAQPESCLGWPPRRCSMKVTEREAGFCGARFWPRQLLRRFLAPTPLCRVARRRVFWTCWVRGATGLNRCWRSCTDWS
jgi:exo-beta-1,3-glucanase (GH17 family)